MKLEGLKVNFLGDSITAGAGTSCPEAIYHGVLKKNAGLAEVRNYGIGGTRIARQKGNEFRPKDDYVDVNSFCERYEQMEDDADLIVVFGGSNDYGHGDAPLGHFEDRTPDTFYGACHYLFEGLIKKYLGKPIVVITPMHRTTAPNYSLPGQRRDLREYVGIIREVAEYYSLPVLDLYAVSGIQPAIPEVKEKYMPDGLHPNDAGHVLMANRLQKFLENL